MSNDITEEHRRLARELEMELWLDHVNYYEEHNVELITQALADAEARGAERAKREKRLKDLGFEDNKLSDTELELARKP